MGKGRATTFAAISIVNALATGLGAALSINLRLEACVEIESGDGVHVEFEGFQPRDTKLVEMCLSEVASYVGLRNGYKAKVRIRSDIPIARGLKSSSAASNAIVLAAIEALGLRFANFNDKLRTALDLAVNASIKAGVTITGAFDDASASMLGGLTITDNLTRDIIYRSKVRDRLKVVLHIPESECYTAEVDVSRFKRFEKIFRSAWRLSIAGYWMDAMNLNGLAVSLALGYDINPLLDALNVGALAASPSGKGPALAAIVRDDDISRVVDVWSNLDGEVRVVDINNSFVFSCREE